MNTNKAWSLNISTAAQWNSGLENLLTSITDIHLLRKKRTKLKGKGEEKDCKASRWFASKMSPYLQSCNVFSFFFDPTGSSQTNGGRYL